MDSVRTSRGGARGGACAGLLLAVLTGACDDGSAPEPPATDPSPASAQVALAPAPVAQPEPREPEAAPEPVSVRLGAGFTPDPWVVEGTVEGRVEASTLSEGCAGYVATSPTLVFEADTAITELRVIARGEGGGVTLLAQGPDGVFRCAAGDDEGATLDGLFAAGAHKIWLGTSAAGQRVRYRVGFSELPDTTTAAVATAALAR